MKDNVKNMDSRVLFALIQEAQEEGFRSVPELVAYAYQKGLGVSQGEEVTALFE